MGKSSFRLKRFCSKNVMLKVFMMEDCFFFTKKVQLEECYVGLS